MHDLKNQLNGLKLYATFLKKRMEKGERPADELETIGKIIAGLERAATDMTVLVRYGRPLDVRPQPRVDLARLLAEAAGDVAVRAEGEGFEGDFDAPLLGEALQIITAGAGVGNGRNADAAAQDSPRIRLRRDDAGAAPEAVIEWGGGARAGVPEDVFDTFAGGQGLRLALAARIIRSHGGEVGQESGVLHARLPLSKV
ncbi:MAG TPA: hypothetical protein VF064_08675 [Pyrinomonadaceae bacterium]